LKFVVSVIEDRHYAAYHAGPSRSARNISASEGLIERMAPGIENIFWAILKGAIQCGLSRLSRYGKLYERLRICPREARTRPRIWNLSGLL